MLHKSYITSAYVIEIPIILTESTKFVPDCMRADSVPDKRGVSGQKPNKAGNMTRQNK